MKKFTYLISIALFVILISSIIPRKIGNLWFNQYLTLIFFSLLGGSLYLYRFNKTLSIFSLGCLFSTYWVTRCSPRPMLLLFQLYMGMFVAFGISFLDIKNRKAILKAILIMTCLQLFWCILQLYNKDPIFHSIYDSTKDSTVGFSGAPDQIGAFFALVSPILISTNPLLIAIPVAGIYFSKSSFAAIAFIIPSLLFFYQFNKNLFSSILITMVVLSILFFSKVEKLKPIDFKTRIDVWKYATTSTVKGQIAIKKGNRNLLVNTKPLYGYGFGNFLAIFPFVPQQKNFNYVDEKFEHAHNDYVELFFELGYIGLVLLVSLIGFFIFNFIKFRQDRELSVYFYSIFAYLLNSMGNFLSQLAVSGTLLIVFYGLYEARRRELIDGKNTSLV